MSHISRSTQTRHNDFLVPFFCDGRRSSGRVTCLTVSFLLPPFVTSFFAGFLFSFLAFLSTHMPFFKARRQRRVLGGGNCCILGWWFFFFFATSDEVGKGGAQTDITQRKHAHTYGALVFFSFHVLLLIIFSSG
jgi:hypothetical protein